MGRQVTLGRVAPDDETSIKKLEYVTSVVSWWNSKRLILPFGYRFEDARYRILRQGANWYLIVLYDRRTNAEILSEYLSAGSMQTVRVRQLLKTLGRMVFSWQGLKFRVDPGKAPTAALKRTISRIKEANRLKRK